MTDFLTILRSQHFSLTKIIHADGRIDDYPDAKTFNIYERPVNDLDHLYEAVAELLQDKSLIAADIKGNATEVGFARVEAFRIGYTNGSADCAQIGS